MDVIIIGAGPAGLTAGYWLLKNTDIKPIILEASQEIGGISRTVKHNGNRMDIGGHRFFSKSKEVTDLWAEIMPMQGAPASDDLLLDRKVQLVEGGPDPEKEDIVMLSRTRVSRIYFLRKFFDYPVSLSFTTFKNMGLWRTIKAGFGYLWSVVHKREEKSLEDFYINRFGKPLYEMFFMNYTEKVWGIHPSKMSADWGAQRVKGLSLRKAIGSAIKKLFGKKSKETETSLIENFIYPKYGPGQLYEHMADMIEALGGKIIKGAEVCKVNMVGEHVQSVVDTNGQVYTADNYISTMPIKDLFESMSESPEDIKDIAIKLPYRDFITVGVCVNKLKIKNKTKMKTVSNIVPDCWIYIQERDVRLGRLQVFNNWSPYMVKDNENTVWIGLEYFANEGDDLWSKSSEEMIEFALGELVNIGVIEREDVLDTVVEKVKKAYPAYFGAYDEFPKVKEYLLGVDNLYCAGRNGQHRYNNMDHSMLSAIECAKVLSGQSTDKGAIFEVNAEKEYHEQK